MVKLAREYSKDLSILYVEDDIELSRSTRKVLENLFKSVDVAYDGVQGLQAYKDHLNSTGVAYDLVITDINMPKMNGIELCSLILKEVPEQAIIIISAHNEADHLHEAINMGIVAFITKPINHKNLLKTIYKISMSIHDRKFFEGYANRLIDLNLQLDKQNKELSVKNAKIEKSLRLLNSINHKDELMHPNQIHPVNPDTLDSDSLRLQEQLRHFIEEDLSELKELLNEIDLVIIDILNNLNVLKIDSPLLIASLFKKYALTLSMYTFFDDLSVAMSTFSYTLENHPLPQDNLRIQNIFLLLETFVYDMGRWHDDLSSCDESKLNLFDASNIGNIQFITNMWLANDMDEATETDIDAIFDF